MFCHPCQTCSFQGKCRCVTTNTVICACLCWCLLVCFVLCLCLCCIVKTHFAVSAGWSCLSDSDKNDTNGCACTLLSFCTSHYTQTHTHTNKHTPLLYQEKVSFAIRPFVVRAPHSETCTTVSRAFVLLPVHKHNKAANRTNEWTITKTDNKEPCTVHAQCAEWLWVPRHGKNHKESHACHLSCVFELNKQHTQTQTNTNANKNTNHAPTNKFHLSWQPETRPWNAQHATHSTHRFATTQNTFTNKQQSETTKFETINEQQTAPATRFRFSRRKLWADMYLCPSPHGSCCLTACTHNNITHNQFSFRTRPWARETRPASPGCKTQDKQRLDQQTAAPHCDTRALRQQTSV